MQTRKQVKAKIHELTKELMPQIELLVETMLCSPGMGVELNCTNDDFRLPRLIYKQVLREIADRYSPWRQDLQELEERLANL